MIAFASASPLDTAPYLEKLSDFAGNGMLVDGWEKRPGGNHPDGWGIAFRNGNDMKIVRSGKPACSDPDLFRAVARTDRFIGHVRYASNTATVNARNSHPFMVNGIALAHNGTFYGTIGKEADGRNISDTLVFLERLCAAWKDGSRESLIRAVADITGNPELVGDYSSACLLIASGESLFALRRYRRREDYYTLYLKASPGLSVAASQPLDGGEGWRLLENGELVEMNANPPQSVLLRGIT
jgi:predicted glutamine amidotransferase